MGTDFLEGDGLCERVSMGYSKDATPFLGNSRNIREASPWLFLKEADRVEFYSLSIFHVCYARHSSASLSSSKISQEPVSPFCPSFKHPTFPTEVLDDLDGLHFERNHRLHGWHGSFLRHFIHVIHGIHGSIGGEETTSLRFRRSLSPRIAPVLNTPVSN